jgi:hypothetical protein
VRAKDRVCNRKVSTHQWVGLRDAQNRARIKGLGSDGHVSENRSVGGSIPPLGTSLKSLNFPPFSPLLELRRRPTPPLSEAEEALLVAAGVGFFRHGAPWDQCRPLPFRSADCRTFPGTSRGRRRPQPVGLQPARLNSAHAGL